MKKKPLRPEDASHGRLFDEYIGTDIQSLEEIFNTRIELQKEHPGHSVLVTLDDLGQAQYTSMHATMSHELDSTEGHDLSNVDPIAFEDGEHIGYLSTKSEFFIIKENLLSKAKHIQFSDVCKSEVTLDDNELADFEDIHLSPLDYIDSDILLKIVPVTSSSLAISAFPNGYFSCDLNPLENYALANHLEQKYGYELFGLGASLLGFKRDTPIEESIAKELAADLAKLYSREGDKVVFELLYNLIRNHDYLFLKYVESLEF